MPILDAAYLDRLADYITSGDLEMDFDFANEEGRGIILEFLEKLMDVAETADELATKLIFKGQLGALAGAKPQK